MEERRRLKRRHLIYYLRVFERDSKQLIGHLVDITPEGILIISEEPKDPDLIFNFHMDLPEELIGKVGLEFEAKSMWCRKDINPDFYAIGFQLLNIAPQDIEIIGRLIEDFGFRD
jgi:hypothetical protein